jgi:hypothetical protein
MKLFYVKGLCYENNHTLNDLQVQSVFNLMLPARSTGQRIKIKTKPKGY